MASFYDSASIITIPSGYKAGTLYSAKPTDGTGDMTFTRTGDTATRVNSSGIIERCITNTALQSNGFDTASWTKGNTIVATGITDPNGGTTAFSLAGSSATSNTKNLLQSNIFTATSEVKTISIYAKANTHSFIQIRLTTTNIHVNFDLTNGTFSAGASASGTMTSIGGGWYRCQMTSGTTTNISGSIQLIDSLAAVFNESSTTTNSVYIWRAQAQLFDFATNYIDTTTAAVTQGPVTNLPRLDYLGSTCPQLLMEPTRTNLALYSQMFDISTWSKQNSSSVSGNVLVSPDGYANADLVRGAAGATSRIQQNFTAVSGTTYAFSGFVKQGPDNAPTGFSILSNANANLATINIVFTGGVPAITASLLALNAKAENYGNGWYRISGTYVAPASETNKFAYYADTSATSKSSYLWGAQVEAGAYATSYIPTTAATVTRNLDNCRKTNIASLIGQTEGTLFVDFNKLTDSLPIADSAFISLNANNTSTRIYLAYNLNSLNIQYRVNTTVIYSGDFAMPLTRNKVAVAYKLNDLVLYLNGVQIASFAVTADFSTYNLTQFAFGLAVTNAQQFIARTNQALVFKTRLTNDELATLTTL